MKNSKTILLIIAMCMLLFEQKAFSSDKRLCTYDTYQWNTLQKRAVNFKRIEKHYDELSENEVDAQSGCTVCQQDQVTIRLDNLPAFKVCQLYAEKIEFTLKRLLKQGEPIYKVIGYRVGQTRGDPDYLGNRTQFSNHSYGIAIDINPEHNGLYDNCITINSECRLIKGGEWRPGRAPESLMTNSATVQAMKKAGFKWGGKIAGKQKDFMHFSPSGY